MTTLSHGSKYIMFNSILKGHIQMIVFLVNYCS